MDLWDSFFNIFVTFLDLPVSRTSLLNFTSDQLTVLVDRQLIVKLRINETKSWQVVYTIECPQKVLHGSVSGNVLVVVENDHSIRILFSPLFFVVLYVRYSISIT